MSNLEYRAVIKFLTKQGKSPQVIMEEMLGVYGNTTPSRATIYNWHNEFRRGRESLEDDPRTGRPVEATTVDIVAKIEQLVLEDGRLKKKQLAQLTGVSETTVLRILHDHLGMSKVSARWVPRMLTPMQKQNRVETCKLFLDMCGGNPDDVIARIVTGDEVWVHHYDPTSKQESMEWRVKGTAPPKKFKVAQSAGKVMATVFWDSKGILLIDYKDKGVSITGDYYANILHNLRCAIKEKRRGMLTKGVLLLHDNAPVHKARIVMAAIRKCQFEELHHPAYSPDLAPSDYFLFPNLKKDLRGKKYDDNSQLISAVNDHFEGKDEMYYLDGLRKLIHRAEKCILLKGDYIEKEK